MKCANANCLKELEKIEDVRWIPWGGPFPEYEIIVCPECKEKFEAGANIPVQINASGRKIHEPK